ncbi:alpha/beta fold hydrolase [Actinocorallia populi]|uniref:alpha/beta fold hydrolase n=1 Tax=Actinocorallia populi TaxID=2079200 RepID=UPI000D08DBD0|nr:alpha/beta hydrolase [Actinocorallia populi]
MLAYERVGTGEPLVLLHGLSHRRQGWYPVLDRLTERREVVLVDLPGHGESPELGPGAPAEAMLKEIRLLLDHLGLDRPHVAGNSLGGRLALELAAQGAARSATVFSPAGFWNSGAEFAYTRSLFQVVTALAARLETRSERLIATKAGRALAFGWIHARPHTALPELALGDFQGLLRALPTVERFIKEREPLRATVSRDVPVTIAWGWYDLVLPLYQSSVARRRFPHARHFRLPGCGHVPMVDDPALVSRLLLRGSDPVR